MTKVAVLIAHNGTDLVIRNGPTQKEVLTFVKGQNERFHNHIPGGSTGQPAVLIQEAYFWPSEEEYRTWKYSKVESNLEPTLRKEINLSSVLPPKEDNTEDKD